MSNIFVTNLTIDGADNGIRIKSGADRGGQVRQIRYENVCMRNVTYSLIFDPFYSTRSGTTFPDFQEIELSDIHIVSSSNGSAILKGYNNIYPLKIKLDNVQSDVELTTVLSHTEITLGPGNVKGLALTNSTDVKISGRTSPTPAISCIFPQFGQ